MIKILTSNGAAPRTKATSDILHAMHLVRDVPLKLHVPRGPQIEVAAEDTMKQLMSECGSQSSAAGFYGVSAHALIHDRGNKKKEETLMRKITRL